MELVKAYVNIRGDEGTNGLVSIDNLKVGNSFLIAQNVKKNKAFSH